MKTYTTFKRTWWVYNPSWPDSLEPGAGEKLDIEYWDTKEDARDHCQYMNADSTNFPVPNTYSMKYEFDKV